MDSMCCHVWALSLSHHTDRQAAQDLILSAAATLHIPLPTQGAKQSWTSVKINGEIQPEYK